MWVNIEILKYSFYFKLEEIAISFKCKYKKPHSIKKNQYIVFNQVNILKKIFRKIKIDQMYKIEVNKPKQSIAYYELFYCSFAFLTPIKETFADK